MDEPVLVIAGPTASGKTAIAIEVARRIGGEIISMDSRQVYRGMDIGTAKPSTAERATVPHHGLDLLDPDARFNAGQFADLARQWMKEIRARGNVPVLAGGTGFFLRALTHPMFEEPDLDPARKEAWKRYLADLPLDTLQRWAAELDPGAGVRPQDRQRLARVVEMAVMTGRTLSWWHSAADPARPALDPCVFVLDLPRAELYRRINVRVDAMIEQGLVEEVRGLLSSGYDESSPGMNATGYIELIPHVRGDRSVGDAVDMIKVATRRYARRQITWLRHQLPHSAAWLEAGNPRDDLAEAIVLKWREVMA